jgi:phenylalanyl-tRNA synthetase alpha chain
LWFIQQFGIMAAKSGISTAELALEVLQALSKHDQIISAEVFPEVPFDTMKSAVDRLASRSMVESEQVEREEAILEPEAESIVEHGSHEARVFDVVKKMNGLSIQDLEKEIGDKNVTKMGQGKAFKEKWIKKDGQKLVPLVDSITDTTREQLQTVKDKKTHGDSKILADLKKRKLIKMQKVISFRLRKGPNFALEIVKEETDLTSEMLASGAWKEANFKAYNFKALGAQQNGGAIHPLQKVRQAFRQIFFEMAFVEMPTNQFVESGFWNFDALYVPQQHPARDLQDTFYVSDPKVAGRPKAESPDDDRDYDEYVENVKAVHENGKYGSIGYRYPWSEEESMRWVNQYASDCYTD